MNRDVNEIVIRSRYYMANILSRMAIYFLSFGLIMLLLGGVRSVLFASNVATRVLVIIGLTVTALGILLTFCVACLIKMIQASVADSDLENPYHSSSRTISAGVPFGRVPGPGSVNSNHGLTNDDGDWEPPPSYEDAVKEDVANLQSTSASLSTSHPRPVQTL
ncbi:hypothetical protein HDE_05592 [Halotydeus destructor]|nr:hypothetical protein HDE_05592 [Halotydeus destructor]